ncbi:MAG: tetratricopeptide repeat protein [Magnetococcales bacterium]|nr:tetratricopeptide repeat protein [Magnetococcales bacterium]
MPRKRIVPHKTRPKPSPALPLTSGHAFALYAAGNLSQALAVATQLLATPPQDASLCNLAAVCHMRLGEAAQAIACWQQALRLNPDYADAYANLGLLLHELHRLDEAEAAYRQVVRLQPDQANAHYSLGLLLQEMNRGAEAEAAYRHLLRLQPNHAATHANLGVLLKTLHRPEEAETAYRQALRLQPDHAGTHNNLGNLLKELLRPAEAEAAYRQALRLQPDYAEAHYNLGALLHQQNRRAEAETSYQTALRLRPDYLYACNNLGVLLKELHRYEEAEVACQQALRLQPDYAEAHYNWAVLLHAMHRSAESEAAYRQAIHLQPDYAKACNNLGILLQEQNRPDEAEAAFGQALHLCPDYAEACSNLGVLLQKQERFAEAEAAFQQALHLQPDNADTHNNLGNLLKELKRSAEAEAAYRQALHRKPDHGNALGMAYHCAQMQCQWQHILADDAAVQNALRQGVTVQPFPLFTLPHEDGLLQCQASALYAVEQVGPLLEMPPLVNPGRPLHRDRLRIGYLSADLRNHPVAHLVAGVLETHDPTRFARYHYAIGPDTRDAYRQRFIQSADLFRNLAPLSDAQAAWQIAGDGIDILVDLTGYTQHCRPGIPVRRPAPIQVNWLGYTSTLGHPRLADYLIGDPIVTPPQQAACFSETLALLPHCFQANDRTRPCATPPTRTEAGLPETGFVFCVFTQSYKIRPEMFDLWCRLLRAVPDSVLWLLEPAPIAMANLRREATVRGVSPDRLLFAPFLPPDQHRGRLSLADLALDTFPFTSATTGSDALWSGVPFITRIGNTFVSRVAASLLQAAGLPELITETWDTYFALALALATQRERLQAVRQRLAANRLTCPLFDTERFTRDLERLYTRMGQDYAQDRREIIILSDRD